MAELKPCPFCGRTPTVDDCGNHRYFVRCKCGIVQDKLYMQKCDAVRRWNTRKTGKIAKDANVPTTDNISRQAAIDALCKRCDLAADDDEPCTEKCIDIKILEKMPPAQTKEAFEIGKPYPLKGYELRLFKDVYGDDWVLIKKLDRDEEVSNGWI